MWHDQVGRSCLASSAPQLHRSLVQLLYSDRKPGEVGTRQIMAELITGLFGLNFTVEEGNTALEWKAPLGSMTAVRQIASPQPAVELSSRDPLFGNHCSHQMVKSLVMGPPDEAEESRVDFIRQAHRSRRFKKFVIELTGVLSDFFWIFAHGSNLFLQFRDLEESKFSAPAVPGGMTAGVEFEAMYYVVSRL